MHLAVVHGYLLRGTGSNLFVANLCKKLCALGHDVTLFCQEGNILEHDFISRWYEFTPDNRDFELRFSRETRYPGKCHCYRPNLGGLLPVYVYDRYPGYEVKEYVELTREEIERYIERNATAMRMVFQRELPYLIQSNHTIMQPVYTARALQGLPPCFHVMTVHGSCLNFSVRKSEMLREYALEAISAAQRIVFVSEHSRREFLEFFRDKGRIAAKSMVIPAGVDTDEFTPLAPGEKKENRIEKLIPLLDEQGKGLKGRTMKMKDDFARMISSVGQGQELIPKITVLSGQADEWVPDQDAGARLRRIDWNNSQIIVYSGKYLWTKGAHLLIAASPLVLKRFPKARFILVGFGSFRGYLEALAASLAGDRRDLFLYLLAHPEDFGEKNIENHRLFFTGLEEKLQRDKDFSEAYFNVARKRLKNGIIFTGIMNHQSLKELLACAEVVVVPSIFPEAFGTVAVEALACGVIPLSANHSGLSEIIREVVEEFRDTFDESEFRPILPDGEMVLNLANNLNAFLEEYAVMDWKSRQGIRRRAREIALKKYSWEAVARAYLKFGQERL